MTLIWQADQYNPTEIVAGYAAASGFIKGAEFTPNAQFFWFCLVSITLLILTQIYLMFITKSKSSLTTSNSV